MRRRHPSNLQQRPIDIHVLIQPHQFLRRLLVLAVLLARDIPERVAEVTDDGFGCVDAFDQAGGGPAGCGGGGEGWVGREGGS